MKSAGARNPCEKAPDCDATDSTDLQGNERRSQKLATTTAAEAAGHNTDRELEGADHAFVRLYHGGRESAKQISGTPGSCFWPLAPVAADISGISGSRSISCVTISVMPRPQITEEAARKFAQEWIDAWNAHDLESVLDHYSADVVLISPMAAKLLPDSGGQISGIANLRRYFVQGLAAFPKLRFELIDISAGPGTLVLLYRNHAGITVSEFMEVDNAGKVKRVLASYS